MLRQKTGVDSRSVSAFVGLRTPRKQDFSQFTRLTANTSANVCFPATASSHATLPPRHLACYSCLAASSHRLVFISPTRLYRACCWPYLPTNAYTRHGDCRPSVPNTAFSNTAQHMRARGPRRPAPRQPSCNSTAFFWRRLLLAGWFFFPTADKFFGLSRMRCVTAHSHWTAAHHALPERLLPSSLSTASVLPSPSASLPLWRLVHCLSIFLLRCFLGTACTVWICILVSSVRWSCLLTVAGGTYLQ